MKYLKTLLCLLLLLVLGLSVIFFAGHKNNVPIKIGIMQIVEHESLDRAKQGFIDQLKELGYESGKNVKFDFQNAGGDLSNCMSIAEKFVNDRKNLIMALSTPCAQAAANATKDIPILATAITNFESTGLIKSNQKPGTNVTGTSDLAPIDKIIKLILKLNPSAKKIGILYSNVDTSPQFQAELAEKNVKEIGLEPKMFSVSQTQEVQQVTERLANEVDALYVPIDKITSSTMPQISQIFLAHNKFVVCAENAMIAKGAIAVYGMDYYELGKITARQAVEILEGKSEPKNMPIEYLKDIKLTLNKEIIKELSIKIPDDLKGELQ